MTAVMENKIPERIPLCIYGDFLEAEPELEQLFDQNSSPTM